MALIRSLLPGPPARTHWPRDIAHCLDSPGLGQRKEEVPRSGHPRAGLATPENTSHLSLPTYMPVQRPPWEHVGQGSATPGCSAEGGGLCLDQGAQLSPPARHPSRALGCLPSAAKEHWKENGKSNNRYKEKGRHYQKKTADLRFSSSPGPRRGRQGGRRPFSVAAKPGAGLTA